MSDWATHFSAEERAGKVPIANRSFAGLDLTGARLDGAQLSGCNFANATLRDASFNGARLFGCDFTGVDASGCEATGTSFVDVTWRGGRTVGADFGKGDFANVDLRDNDMTGAVLRGAELARSDLRGAKLVRADLRRRARFTGCDLRGVDIDGALLGSTELEDCAVHGMLGSPEEPYFVAVTNADLTRDRDRSQLGGWDALAAMWRAQRKPDSRRAPFDLGPPVTDPNLEPVVVMQIIEIRPDLDSVFGAPAPVFPVLVPWMTRVFAAYATEAKPPRLVCAALFPDLTLELFEDSAAALTRAAAAEPVRLSSADDALAYARFGYYVTRGAKAGAAWLGQERVDQTSTGWLVHASTEIAGRTVANRITVGRDGEFRCEEHVA